MKKLLNISALMVFIFFACGKENEIFISLKTEFISINEIEPDKAETFSCFKNNDHYSCSLKTTQIRKNQQVKSISAGYKGDELFIHIFLDKDLFPEPLDRTTLVDFNLYGIPKGKYKLRIFVENVEHSLTNSEWFFY